MQKVPMPRYLGIHGFIGIAAALILGGCGVKPEPEQPAPPPAAEQPAPEEAAPSSEQPAPPAAVTPEVLAQLTAAVDLYNEGVAELDAGNPDGQAKVDQAKAQVEDPEGDPLSYEWLVASESTDLRIGGESETAGAAHPDLVRDPQAPACVFTTPANPGNYRLFLTVRDGQGNAATANFPFRVEP